MTVRPEAADDNRDDQQEVAVSDDQSVLAELGIDVENLDVPANAWSTALEAAFDPAAAPVAGDVVPDMDDEPRLPGDPDDIGEIDLGEAGPGDPEPVDHDVVALEARESNSRRDQEIDDEAEDGDEAGSGHGGGAAAGAIQLDEDGTPGLDSNTNTDTDSGGDASFGFDL